MRNLKRALSLGLTATMISGLMVMGSSAASYADVTSKQNEEAIEVLKTVGIMVGDENGKFNPEAKVTRNEMAVVMCNLLDYTVASYKGTSPFTDRARSGADALWWPPATPTASPAATTPRPTAATIPLPPLRPL